jgi:MFS family permease
MTRYLSKSFASLRNRNYRIYAAGQGISVTGTWMQKVAQVLLVLDLTHSGTLLGVTAALHMLPTLLLTPWGGLLADRVDKRRILLWTQGLSVVPAVILGVLTATGTVTIEVVLALAMALGCIDALDKPARHTFVNDLVAPEDLTNAVGLNNIVQNAGKVVGPAIAGIVIAAFGLAWGFFINAVSFLAVLAALALLRPGFVVPRTTGPRERGQLREGLRYVRSRPDLFAALVLMSVSGLLAYNWTVVLPLLARDTFDAGPTAVGLTFTVMGAGAVIGGLALAGTLRATRGRLALWAMAFASMIAAVAVSPTLEVAFVFLFVLGTASVLFRTLVGSMLQLRADPAMRGRVISLFVLATGGTTPLGAPLVGWICETFGVRTALAIAATATAAAALWAFRYMRRAGAEQPAEVAVGARA